jgi:hypothetical protein
MTVLRHDVAAEVIPPSTFMSTVNIRRRPVLNNVLETAVTWWRGKLVDERGDKVYVYADSSQPCT